MDDGRNLEVRRNENLVRWQRHLRYESASVHSDDFEKAFTAGAAVSTFLLALEGFIAIIHPDVDFSWRRAVVYLAVVALFGAGWIRHRGPKD